MVTTRRDLRTGRSVWEGRRAAKVRHARPRTRSRDRRADRRRRHHRRDDRRRARRRRARGHSRRSQARSGQGLDRRLHRARAIRDRHSALAAVAQDRQERTRCAHGGGRASRSRRSPRACPNCRCPMSCAATGSISRATCSMPTGLRASKPRGAQSGLPDRLLSRKELKARFGIARAAALLAYGNLVIDPRKTAHALLAAAIRNGARVLRTGLYRGYRMPCAQRHRAHRYRTHDPLPLSGDGDRLRIPEIRADARPQDRIDLRRSRP